jgi:DNA-directed RNA polymerase subunit K/omega
VIESMDMMKGKDTCKFAQVMLVAKRARNLVKGYRPLIDDPTSNPVTTAIREVSQDKVHFRWTKE